MKSFITEKEIRYAASIAMTNKQAAQLLKVTCYTWNKHARLYLESNYNITYYEYLKRKIKLTKKTVRKITNKSLNDILQGLQPTYNKQKLFNRLIKEGIFLEVCAMCGYCEKNVLTNRVPLVLSCIDGNDRNFLRSNLELVCYNCAYQVGYTFKTIKQ